ncbi:hypothetical protein M413DRAFT_14608 [Hebeloma cylindrosporum]|uniref:F-box domain-containing protein n=1 Tax=Hebeloma cylindrosporum TaxID=76867 RepID=A0A0C2XBI0_HEBCY|nr:hypothetical protein M413DRAFT_14608 [Hebeloma cylindrosporum h7]
MANNDNPLPQGSSSKKRKAPEMKMKTRSRSSRARVQVQSPDPENRESSSSAPHAPARSSKKRKAREYDDADFTEASTTAKPPVKRTRGSRRLAALTLAAATQAGNGLLGLAVELFCQICYGLRPVDLLNLSRVCKTFQALLHDPSSTIIWRNVRIANGIPDFASKFGITEQRFADLAFGDSCHVCSKVAKFGTSMKRTIIWEHGIVVCDSEACTKETLVDASELEFNDIPYLVGLVILGDNVLYPKKLLSNLILDYKARRNAKAKCELACRKWLAQYKEQQAKDRMGSVFNELKRRGWAQEIASMKSRGDEPTIEQIRKLQEKCQHGLSASALQELVEALLPMMEAERTKRLEDERDKQLEYRLKLLEELQRSCVLELPANSLVPSSADLFMYSEVRQLIESSSNEETFTLEHLNPVKASFMATSKLWVSEIKAKLFAMMEGQTLPTGEEARDIHTVLNLATTFFICSSSSCRCRVRLARDPVPSFRYQRVTMHACARQNYHYESELEEPFQTLHRHLGILPWNHLERISFDTTAYHLTRELVTMCGLDPDNTTAKEMDTLNPIFECLHCSNPQGRCTMTWECAVKHHAVNGPHHCIFKSRADVVKSLALVLLDESEVKLVRPRMAEALARERAVRGYDGLCCSICKVTGNSAYLAYAKSTSMQAKRKLVPCLDRRQYPEEYWLWPPRNSDGVEIEPSFDTDLAMKDTE